eukprot:SAG31_NODE_430_length_15792_cov_15.908558_15_plen_338_part_00
METGWLTGPAAGVHHDSEPYNPPQVSDPRTLLVQPSESSSADDDDDDDDSSSSATDILLGRPLAPSTFHLGGTTGAQHVPPSGRGGSPGQVTAGVRSPACRGGNNRRLPTSAMAVDLSSELILAIAVCLPDRALAAAMQCCTCWAATIRGAEALWEQRCTRLWGAGCTRPRLTRLDGGAAQAQYSALSPPPGAKKVRLSGGGAAAWTVRTVQVAGSAASAASAGSTGLSRAAGGKPQQLISSWRQAYVARRRLLVHCRLVLTGMPTEQRKRVAAAARALGAKLLPDGATLPPVAACGRQRVTHLLALAVGSRRQLEARRRSVPNAPLIPHVRFEHGR